MITSMLDMFTIILVFLLNFLDPSTDALQEVELPSVPGAAEIEVGTVLTLSQEGVFVDGDQVLALNGALPAGAALDPLRARLQARRAAEPDARNPSLLVQCDRRTPYTSVAAILDVAEDAGFGGFRFVVLDATD